MIWSLGRCKFPDFFLSVTCVVIALGCVAAQPRLEDIEHDPHFTFPVHVHKTFNNTPRSPFVKALSQYTEIDGDFLNTGVLLRGTNVHKIPFDQLYPLYYHGKISHPLHPDTSGNPLLKQLLPSSPDSATINAGWSRHPLNTHFYRQNLKFPAVKHGSMFDLTGSLDLEPQVVLIGGDLGFPLLNLKHKWNIKGLIEAGVTDVSYGYGHGVKGVNPYGIDPLHTFPLLHQQNAVSKAVVPNYRTRGREERVPIQKKNAEAPTVKKKSKKRKAKRGRRRQ